MTSRYVLPSSGPVRPLQQHLDDVVAMALHARRSRQRRRHHRARRGARQRRGPRRRRRGTRSRRRRTRRSPCCSSFCSPGVRRGAATAAAESAGRRRRQQTLADERARPCALFAACAALTTSAASGSLNRFSVSIAWMTTFGSGSFVERAVVVGKRLVAGLVERLARANRLDAHARVRVLHLLAHQRRVERAEPFERPQRVEARDEVVRRPRASAAAPARPTCPASGPAAAAPCRATSRSDA